MSKCSSFVIYKKQVVVRNRGVYFLVKFVFEINYVRIKTFQSAINSNRQ